MATAKVQMLAPLWIRLSAVVAILMERGMGEATARAQIIEAISSWRLTVRCPGARVRRKDGPGWLTTPRLDFERSTIVIPWIGPEGSWQNLQPEWRPTLVEVSAADVDRLWPVLTGSRIVGDAALVEEAMEALRDGRAANKHQAAIMVADRARGASHEANVRRMYRAIGKAMRPSVTK